MEGMDRDQSGETLTDVLVWWPSVPCGFWLGDCLGLPRCRASAVCFPEPRSRGWFV